MPSPLSQLYYHFLRITGCVGLIFGVGMPAQSIERVSIQIEPNTSLGRVSTNFIGFGYETSAVAQSNFFSSANLAMVRLYKNLSPHGLIRIGGIISDHTRYIPDGASAARTQNEVTVINRKNLVDLGDFARVTGWKVMWGLNLGTGSKAEAVQEALAVKAALGGSLQSFQIGNEVEALRRFDKSYPAYHTAYREYKSAIRAVVPDAPFSGPDCIGDLNWLMNFVATEARDMQLLTQHYYRGGAKDAGSTLAKLLETDRPWNERLDKLRQICRDNGLAYRINEVNSFYGGGKPGVSDTFGSALWCLDYMFNLAAHGCDGVNMETDINQLGFISHYSPIVHDASGHCSARPEYYGMLAFALAGRGELLKLSLEKTNLNLSAYATRENEGVLWITVINKDPNRDALVKAVLPAGYGSVFAMRLRAPSPESKAQVTLAGAEVSADGTWAAGSVEEIVAQEGAAQVVAPHASALLLQLRPEPPR